jgi:3,4-dihydroxy 2-butanone 4-phosphate synthase/GTP cyclohydrolase II
MITIPEAIERLKQGRMIIMTDDEDRENEGDLILAAEHATPETINFMAKYARGLICLTLTKEKLDALEIPMMTAQNKDPKQTAFTVSIEARTGVTTGISAADRARTIRVAIDKNAKADDLVSPGHIFPLRAVAGGVLVRAGHTEASVDLCKIGGLQAGAVICEIMNDDGTMARMPDLQKFGIEHDLPIVTIKALIEYRLAQECLVEEAAVTRFPSQFAQTGTEFKMHAFKSLVDGVEHLAIVAGDLKHAKTVPLVRVHSECLTGDALGSLRCDCGQQLQSALKQIAQSGCGVLVYMRDHEGRGIGLANKIKAYALQDQGLDTVEANHRLGFADDLRQYGIGAQILRYLGVSKMRLLTNNPRKIVSIEGFGLEITEKVSIEMATNPDNIAYLNTKRDKLGHTIQNIQEV